MSAVTVNNPYSTHHGLEIPAVPALPRVIGSKSQSYLADSPVKIAFNDPDYLPGIRPAFGQDLQFSGGSKAREIQDWQWLTSDASTEATLRADMQRLRFTFSITDRQEISNSLVEEFFTPRDHVVAFTRESLNDVTKAHPSFITYRANMINEFGRRFERVGFNLRSFGRIQNIPLPNFRRFADRLRGTFFMVDRLAHTYTLLTDIEFDPNGRSYHCKFRFLFYDVFGLDDNDVRRYGLNSGVRAWWLLQHQYGYAPLVTRIVVDTSMTFLIT